MKIIEIQQGSDEWCALRLRNRCASEAAAVFGQSKHMKRSELLHMKATGLPREFSDYVQTHILDKGHEYEAGSRALVEGEIGDDLFPITATTDDGYLWASLDGLTMDGDTLFESKRWNEELAAQVRAGELEPHYYWQLEQELAVTNAKRVIFACSDGVPERHITMEYRPVAGRAQQLIAAWIQFDADLAAYVPPAPAVLVVAAPVQALPAVSVQVTGEIAVRENFHAFETALRDFLEHRLIREPKTDQDFATLDVQIKAMKGAEAALDAAESQMLAQIQTVDSAKKTKDMLAKLVRDNRLMAEKLLASEKERRRGEIVAGGAAALREHIDGLNQRLGKPYMPAVPADFGGVIKGMKSLASMEDKVATELARAKIAANEIADRLQVNLAYLREHAVDHRALFPDTATIVHKAPDDLQALVTARIAEHQAAEEKRLAAERERIRAEEAARLAREQEAKAAEERRQQEAAAREEAARLAAEAAKPAPAPAFQTVEIPADLSQGRPEFTVVPAVHIPRAAASPPTLRLGQITARLGITITADFLADLGFQATVDKSSRLYHEADFPRMCLAIEQHIAGIRTRHERRAA